MEMAQGLRLLLLCVSLSPGLTLRCNFCTGLPYDCKESTQLCTLDQTSCMSQAFTVVEGGNITEWTYKGCSQGLVCNQSVYTDLSYKQTYVSSQCCISDFCNTGTYYAQVPVSGLSCSICQGNSASCAASNLASLRCAGVQDRCMTIKTLYVNVSISDVVFKGCGKSNLCERQLEYNAGGARVYTQVSCCGSNNCNQGVQSVTVNNSLNGVQCYACNETGKGECTTPTNTIVSCTGNMNRCLDVVGFPRGNTLLRGCCSKDVCWGLSASLSIQASQKLYCCQGNLCNNGKITSYFSSGSTTAHNGLLIGGAILVLIKGLWTMQ
ncbi:phospholipase A2 inhibitor gamma subunit B-like [Hyla sarda]|uniref:phospholipase A2 inhibitor gamma subunit B-like n=1 Tax=Hyla sarda TaxID=327740 RepID=UPI0024C3C09C|nr:phospholipase A2 inhibitor gamma subunit B-like [Hyla sarda]